MFIKEINLKSKTVKDETNKIDSFNVIYDVAIVSDINYDSMALNSVRKITEEYFQKLKESGYVKSIEFETTITLNNSDNDIFKDAAGSKFSEVLLNEGFVYEGINENHMRVFTKTDELYNYIFSISDYDEIQLFHKLIVNNVYFKFPYMMTCITASPENLFANWNLFINSIENKK